VSPLRTSARVNLCSSDHASEQACQRTRYPAQVRNNQTLVLSWRGAANVTSVTLVAPGTSTHSWNANQRVIFCDVSSIHSCYEAWLLLHTDVHPSAPAG
jgi:hypothetical protein